MNDAFDGKSIADWIAALRFDDVPERCAAALALAEFVPDEHLAKLALHAALEDLARPVQAAAEIALGFVPVSVEDRQKMYHGLIGSDESMRLAILERLASLIRSDIRVENRTTPPDERIALGEAGPAGANQGSVQPTIPAAEPDIAIIRGLPWLFLAVGVVAFAGLAWSFRGIWWSRWPMAVFLIFAGLFLFFGDPLRQKDALTSKIFRARARFAWAVIVACAAGMIIVWVFPSGSILVENATQLPVRILLDGNDWSTLSPGETKTRALTAGKYHVTIQTLEGHALDAHDIEVASHQKHVLNVLGAQVYFDGVVQYGINGGSMKIVTEKWFRLPEVDYLFRNPPERIISVNPVNKSYFTRGAPPKLAGDERH